MDAERIRRINQAAIEASATWTYGRRPYHVSAENRPQRLCDASPAQRRVAYWAARTTASGVNLCAQWIERVYAAAGVWYCTVDAEKIYEWYCPLTELPDLKVGMAVAVPSHPHSMSGRVLGHVGLYVGDDLIADCMGAKVRHAPLEAWLNVYGTMSEPRWGWLFSVDLSTCS